MVSSGSLSSCEDKQGCQRITCHTKYSPKAQICKDKSEAHRDPEIRTYPRIDLWERWDSGDYSQRSIFTSIFGLTVNNLSP